MKTTGLRFRLTMSFVAFALILFVMISVFTNFFLKRQFAAYTRSQLTGTIQDTVDQIESRYASAGGWDGEAMESIGVNALGAGYMLRITASDGTVVWDAWQHNNGFCSAMLEHISATMETYESGFQGGYREETYALAADGQSVVNVKVGYYGPYFYSDMDIRFIQSLNRFLLIAAVASLAVCLLLGTYMADRLTKPIARVTQAAGRMAKGDFTSRLQEKSAPREIMELTESVNHMADDLSEQELLRKRMTADIAHELKTPLATLQSHMEAMIDGVWEPEPRRLISCHEEVLRLTKLVGELETLSRYENETMKLRREAFDMTELIRRIALQSESAFRDKGVTLAVSERAVWTYADPDKISQVLVNLLSNALKYTPEGGTVRVDATDTTAETVVTVTDTGIGIPQADLPRIFERFYRTDVSRSRATGGSGIGLTIAKSIAEAHGGTITVQSELHRGSVFTLFLPKQRGNRPS